MVIPENKRCAENQSAKHYLSEREISKITSFLGRQHHNLCISDNLLWHLEAMDYHVYKQSTHLDNDSFWI